ncbi:MAG: hypothetical protein Tsb0016_22780 [Sphingomonadales bacterium]
MNRAPAIVRGLLLACALGGCAATAPPAAPPPQSEAAAPDLRMLFRRAYDDAIAVHRETEILDGPLILQDRLGMDLLLPDGRRERYDMDQGVYRALADNTHPPYGIYSIIAINGYGPLDGNQRQRLAEYRAGIVASMASLDTMGLPTDARARLHRILADSAAYIDRIDAAGTADEAGFLDFVQPLRPLFLENFELAADEQLRQFRNQMAVFQARYPRQDWQDLRVVVMGFHQPRRLWTLKQFFQWLIREPDYEHRVVYAEFQFPPFGPRRAAAEALAIELATKVDFDLDAGAVFLGDRTALGQDILGPFASDILKSWGPSTFPD